MSHSENVTIRSPLIHLEDHPIPSPYSVCRLTKIEPDGNRHSSITRRHHCAWIKEVEKEEDGRPQSEWVLLAKAFLHIEMSIFIRTFLCFYYTNLHVSPYLCRSGVLNPNQRGQQTRNNSSSNNNGSNSTRDEEEQWNLDSKPCTGWFWMVLVVLLTHCLSMINPFYYALRISRRRRRANILFASTLHLTSRPRPDDAMVFAERDFRCSTSGQSEMRKERILDKWDKQEAARLITRFYNTQTNTRDGRR